MYAKMYNYKCDISLNDPNLLANCYIELIEVLYYGDYSM